MLSGMHALGRNQCRSSAMIFSLVILVLLGLTFGNPEYFVEADDPFVIQTYPGSPTTPAGCTQHPTKKYGAHTGLNGDETGTTFSISIPSHVSVGASICKGPSYTLKVAFGGGSRRFAILTAVGGILGSSDAYTDIFGTGGDPCAGQRIVVQPAYVQNKDITTTLQVPCNSTDTGVMLALTSAESGLAPFLQISMNYTIVECGSKCVDSSAPASSSGSKGGGEVGEGEHTDDSKGGSTPVSGTLSGSATAGASSQGSVGKTVGGSGVQCKAANTGCNPSASGYPCALNASAGVTLHYSLGTCVPDNACTRGASWTAGSGPPTGDLLHIMAEATTGGYVSVGFTKNPGSMPNTDAIIGFVSGSGQGSLDIYPLSDDSLPGPYPNSSAMLSYSSVLKTSDGRTIICFARPLSSPDYKYSPTLDPAKLQLNQAVGRTPSLVRHRAADGQTIDIITGTAAAGGGGDGETFIYVHGALMVIAWIGLAPVGALLARHKWALGEKKLAGIQVWFHLHRIVQTTAVLTAIVAFIIALKKLDAGDVGVGEAHKVAGFIVMGMAVLQIIAAIPRPSPNSEHRWKWNLLHWWLGRGTLVLAVAVCILGVVLFHENDAEPYARWLVPICVWLGLLLVVDVGLSVVGKDKRGSKVPPMPDTPEYRASAAAHPMYSPTGAV